MATCQNREWIYFLDLEFKYTTKDLDKSKEECYDGLGKKSISERNYLTTSKKCSIGWVFVVHPRYMIRSTVTEDTKLRKKLTFPIGSKDNAQQ